ncbi:unnamed protein product [Ilex paraguariensis]|uniref:Uncharacterized protein n=1 Tax=Ilex paraguariensis TaxID=185542 RepID=A0ABC8SHK2_9AQUA
MTIEEMRDGGKRKMTKEGSMHGSMRENRAMKRRGKGPGDLLMTLVPGGAFISARGMGVLGVGGDAVVSNASGSRGDAKGASGDAYGASGDDEDTSG